MSVAVDWKPYLDRAGEAAKAGRHNEALGVCRDILKADPTNIYAKAISGMVKQMQNNQFEAFSILTDVVKQKDDIAVWHAYLSMAARALDKMDEAFTAAKMALAIDPTNVEYMINIALVLQDIDNFSDAKLYLVKAISSNNTHADAHLAMGQLLLTEGDYKAGFEEYDWRKKTGMGLKAKPQISSMPWNGMVLKQAHLLIIGDQGYGDVFQFSRYIKEASKRVGKVIFASSVELFPIMKEMEGVDICVTKGPMSLVMHFTAWCLIFLAFLKRGSVTSQALHGLKLTKVSRLSGKNACQKGLRSDWRGLVALIHQTTNVAR